MALTTIPAAGAKLRGETLSDLITEVRDLYARVSADQALATSSTVLANVTDLVVSVEANATYTGFLIPAWVGASGVAEDIKFGATFPTGATCDLTAAGPSTNLGAATAVATDVEFVGRLSATSGTTVISYGASTNTVTGIIAITLVTSATAGSFQVQAAQNTSGVNAVTVKAGSKLILKRVA